MGLGLGFCLFVFCFWLCVVCLFSLKAGGVTTGVLPCLSLTAEESDLAFLSNFLLLRG